MFRETSFHRKRMPQKFIDLFEITSHFILQVLSETKERKYKLNTTMCFTLSIISTSVS